MSAARGLTSFLTLAGRISPRYLAPGAGSRFRVSTSCSLNFLQAREPLLALSIRVAGAAEGKGTRRWYRKAACEGQGAFGSSFFFTHLPRLLRTVAVQKGSEQQGEVSGPVVWRVGTPEAEAGWVRVPAAVLIPRYSFLLPTATRPLPAQLSTRQGYPFPWPQRTIPSCTSPQLETIQSTTNASSREQRREDAAASPAKAGHEHARRRTAEEKVRLVLLPDSPRDRKSVV